MRSVGISGLGSTASRIVMYGVWLAFAGVALSGSHTGLADGLALLLLLPAVWLTTADVPEPVTQARALGVVALAGAAVVLVLDPRQDVLFPLVAFATYQIAFVVIRGRALLGLVGYAVTVAVALALAGARGELGALADRARDTSPEALWGPAALALAIGWRALLRRSERRIRRLGRQHTAAAVAEATARERLRTWAEHLRVVTDAAGALLERAASGTPAPGDAAAAVHVEARLRDRTRAPRLVVEPLQSATAAARREGVTVVLLDDGDTSRALTSDQIATVLAHLQDIRPGTRLTVRLNPPGRDTTGTVVRQEGEELTRDVIA